MIRPNATAKASAHFRPVVLSLTAFAIMTVLAASESFAWQTQAVPPIPNAGLIEPTNLEIPSDGSLINEPGLIFNNGGTGTELPSLLPPDEIPVDNPLGPILPPETEIIPSNPVLPQSNNANIGQYVNRQPEWFGFSTPVRMQSFAGENYAEPSAFFALDLLHPLKSLRYQDGSESLQYFDGRVGFNLDGGTIANLGFGHRQYIADSDMIVDCNLWYDVDSTRNRVFQQITAGGQIQNQNFLARLHYYFPVSETEKFAGFTETSDTLEYVGNNLAMERFRLEDQAYKGYDVEIGLMLPVHDKMARWYVGYYNFEAEDAPEINGVSSTLGINVMPALFVSAQVNYDDESETGFLLTASWDFYHGKFDPQADIRHRLGESIRRNRHIVSRKTAIYDPELAADADGNVYNFIHVSNAGNSNGTFESPYSTLSAAATDAAANPGSIILVHADSVFDGESIVLPDNTRFLGEGVSHTLSTAPEQLGDITLPAASTGTALPIIRNSPATGAAITLGSMSEVNGFRIESANATGIFGDGLTGGSSVLNTTIDGAATGVHLANNAGAFTFDNVSITNTTSSGLRIERAAATSALTFNNALTISNAGLYGIHLERNQAGSTATFEGAVSVANTTDHGIIFDDNSDTAAATFNGTTTVDTTGGSGVFFSNLDSGTITTTNDIQFVGDLSINNTTQSGIVANLNDSNVSIQTLAITDWDASAIVINGSTGNFSVVNPLTLNNINGSLSSTIQIANSSSDVNFGDVTITDTVRPVGGTATVNLFQNDTGVDEITFNGLNITTANGVALRGQESGSTLGKLVIRSGTISTTGATAVWLDRISTDVTLQSVSTSNTAIGVNLNNVGTSSAFHDQFRIVGDSSTPGSGGTITNVQRGVVVNGSEDVALHLMTIDSTVAGVSVASIGFNQSENLTVNEMVLTNSGNNSNWVGIDVGWGSGAHFSDANVITNNTISSAGTGQTGLRIVNVQSNPELQATIGGNDIDLTGGSSNGISLSVTGFTPLQTNNSGGINLTTDLDNLVNVTASPFITSQSNGATVTGQILVNGLLVP